MDAQVAVGDAKKLLEFIEGQRCVHGERADDRQPRALVNQAIQIRGGGFGGRDARRSALWLVVARGAESA